MKVSMGDTTRNVTPSFLGPIKLWKNINKGF